MEMPALDPNQRRILERLRAICLALPDAREEMKWGHPNWTVGGKIFAAFGFYGGGPSLATKQTPARQAQLIDDPERFFPSPYVGQHGWTSMRLEGEIDWSVVASLVKTSHGHVTAGPKSKSAPTKTAASKARASKSSAAPSKAAKAAPLDTPADAPPATEVEEPPLTTLAPRSKKNAAAERATLVAAEPKRSERSGPTKKTKPADDSSAAAAAKPTAAPAAKAKAASKPRNPSERKR